MSEMTELEARATLMVDGQASFDEIKKAHRGLVRLLHPDRAGETLQDSASDALKRINLAWETIQYLHSHGWLGQTQPLSPPASDTTASTASQDASTTQPHASRAPFSWTLNRRTPADAECRLCGSGPARPLTLSAVTSILVWHKRYWYSGTYCKACGTAVRQQALEETVVKGWWGAGAVFIPPALIHNLRAAAHLASMESAQFVNLDVSAPYTAPLPELPPVYRRPNPVLTASVAALLAVGLLLFGLHVWKQHNAPTGLREIAVAAQEKL